MLVVCTSIYLTFQSPFSVEELAKSVDSDYNSSSELPSPEGNKLPKRLEKQNMIPSKMSSDTSSPFETSGSPISAEQVALCLLEKVASRKNLTSEDLQWMVSEHDVPQGLLPLPTAVPVSPDDELYDTTENFSRRTSLPVRNEAPWCNSKWNTNNDPTWTKHHSLIFPVSSKRKSWMGSSKTANHL